MSFGYYCKLAILAFSCAFSIGSKANSSEDINLVFNNPNDYRSPEPSCGSDLCSTLLKEINSATQTIDFAIYGMRGQEAIFDALIAAKQRGVVIRGIVDKDTNNQNYYPDTDKLISALNGSIKSDYESDKAYKAPKFKYKTWCERPEGTQGPLSCSGFNFGDSCILTAQASKVSLVQNNRIMHNKFFIFDKKSVYTGSANISDTGVGGYNSNMSVLIRNLDVVALFQEEFDQMHVKGLYHTAKKRSKKSRSIKVNEDLSYHVYFSPQDKPLVKYVLPMIKDAKKNINIGVFYLTSKELAEALIAAHLRGVKIRVINDATSASNEYTKHEALRLAGVPVKVENWGGKMHMKSASIDGKYVITGSMNWTSAGWRTNDENTVIIESKAQAKKFDEYFASIWNSIDNKWLVYNPHPESLDSGSACFDGMDNNFDDLEDANDPMCEEGIDSAYNTPGHRVVPRQDGFGLIKGNISFASGEKVYHMPGQKFYETTEIDPALGEKFFCSPTEAHKAGWRRSYL